MSATMTGWDLRGFGCVMSERRDDRAVENGPKSCSSSKLHHRRSRRGNAFQSVEQNR